MLTFLALVVGSYLVVGSWLGIKLRWLALGAYLGGIALYLLA